MASILIIFNRLKFHTKVTTKIMFPVTIFLGCKEAVFYFRVKQIIKLEKMETLSWSYANRWFEIKLLNIADSKQLG